MLRRAKLRVENAASTEEKNEEALQIVCKRWVWKLGGSGQHGEDRYADILKNTEYTN